MEDSIAEPNRTGAQSAFLEKNYPAIYNARSKVVDGEVVKKYKLRGKWKACVLYVLACATHLRQFRVDLSPRMRKFLETLDPAFDAPCRSRLATASSSPSSGTTKKSRRSSSIASRHGADPRVRRDD